MQPDTTQDRTFVLTTDTVELPLVVTMRALDDFREQGLASMDECLDRLTMHMSPANTSETPSNTQHTVGQMMLDGMATGNTRKVILCALWLAHYHPQATALISNGEKFHFVYGETDVQALPAYACA